MSASYVQIGDTIDYTNPSAVNAIDYGDVVDLDTRIGVAAAIIAASATGPLCVTKVWTFPAINTAAFTVGQEVYWDSAAGKVTNAGEGLTRAGWVVEPKDETATTARVKIG